MSMFRRSDERFRGDALYYFKVGLVWVGVAMIVWAMTPWFPS